MEHFIKKLKPYSQYFILGITLFFIAGAIKQNWQSIVAIHLSFQAWLQIGLGLIITLLSHLWAGVVWFEILKLFKQPVTFLWTMNVYLKTNLAKYIPGNIWHFYGRIKAVKSIGGSSSIAILIALLEPILMACSALFIAVFSRSLGILQTTSNPLIMGLQILILAGVFVGIHPRFLNPIIEKASKTKVKGELEAVQLAGLDKYPLIPFIGEFIFVIIRGIGFIITLSALLPLTFFTGVKAFSVFSFAWLLGLVIPGAPGGLGVFEATTLALLDRQIFPPALLLATVAFYRLSSTLAEVLGAGLVLPLKIPKMEE